MAEKIKILILEDVIEDLELVVFELKRVEIKFTYLHVETEEEFKKGLTEFKPDMILSDYNLPQFNGMEALLITKEISPLTPFIIVTGSINEETAVNCIKSGAWDYVIKENLVRLVPAVKQALERKALIYNRDKAEEQLLKLSVAVKQSPSIIVITDLDGNIDYVNHRFIQVTGYTNEEVIGQKANILNSGKYPIEYYKELWVTISGGFIWRGEFQNKKKNGELYWESASISPVFNDEGKKINYIKVAEDITERRQTEEELRKSEERYKIITESTLDIIFMIDKTGKQLFFNESIERVLGYKVEEVIGESFSKFILKRDIPKYLIQLKHIFMKKEIRNFITQIYHKDGHLVDVEINGKLIKHKENYVGLGTIRDITERKQATRALQESELKFELMIQNSPDMIMVQKITGEVEYVSPQSKNMLGFSSEEIKNLDITKQIHPDDLEDAIKVQQSAFIGEQLINYEYRFIKKNGGIAWLTHTVSPIVIDGKIIQIQSTIRDITKHKHAEKQEEEYHRNIELMSETAMKFVEFQQDKNIYTYIGEQLRDFIGKNSFVIVNSVDEETHNSTIQAVLGMGKFTENISKLLGRHPVGMTIDVDDPNIHYTDGKLHVYEKGIYGLSLKTIPKTICDSIEKLLKIKEIYVIDLAKQEHFFGSIIIFLKDGANEFKNKQVIETFIKQASIAVQKRQAEQSLMASEERFRTLYTETPAMLHSIDKDGKIINVSNRWLKKLGYELEEVMGHNSIEFLSEKSQRFAVEINLPKLFKEGTAENIPYQFVTKSGDVLDILLSAISEKDNKGNIIKSMAVLQDVTQRKKAEEALNKRMSELEIFYEATVNREMKVIELKKEINELHKKLDLETKYEIPI